MMAVANWIQMFQHTKGSKKRPDPLLQNPFSNCLCFAAPQINEFFSIGPSKAIEILGIYLPMSNNFFIAYLLLRMMVMVPMRMLIPHMYAPGAWVPCSFNAYMLELRVGKHCLNGTRCASCLSQASLCQ